MEISDAAVLYADTRSMAIEIFRSLNEEEAGTEVPLNSPWRVTDVAAHVCGIVDDVLNGKLEGLGSDAWTAAQVEQRAGNALGEICDEWQNLAAGIDAVIAGNPALGMGLTSDLILHIHDVQHTLAQTIDRSDFPTRVAAHRYVPSLQQRALEQMTLAVTVELTDGDTYAAPEGAAESIALRTSSYDFLRSVTGRRSRAQVEALGWEGDPAALLDGAWNTYGAMQEHDVSV